MKTSLYPQTTLFVLNYVILEILRILENAINIV